MKVYKIGVFKASNKNERWQVSAIFERAGYQVIPLADGLSIEIYRIIKE